MEVRRGAEDAEEFKGMQRGWFLGSKAFRKEMLGMMSQKAGPEHYGEEIRESADEKAERLAEKATPRTIPSIRSERATSTARVLVRPSVGL